MDGITYADVKNNELHNDNIQSGKTTVIRANISDNEIEKICKEAILLQYSWHKETPDTS